MFDVRFLQLKKKRKSIEVNRITFQYSIFTSNRFHTLDFQRGVFLSIFASNCCDMQKELIFWPKQSDERKKISPIVAVVATANNTKGFL